MWQEHTQSLCSKTKHNILKAQHPQLSQVQLAPLTAVLLQQPRLSHGTGNSRTHSSSSSSSSSSQLAQLMQVLKARTRAAQGKGRHPQAVLISSPAAARKLQLAKAMV